MAVDYFLKIDGVNGESTDQEYPDHIELESWSWGETNIGSSSHGTGMGAGKVAMQDFHFTMRTNKASPIIMMRCADGNHFKNGKLICRRAGGPKQLVYLTIEFEHLIISSYQVSGSGHASEIPMEQISFNYTTVKLTYQAQDETGSKKGGAVLGGWDVKKGVVKT